VGTAAASTGAVGVPTHTDGAMSPLTAAPRPTRLPLPRVPWNGGPAYWARFARTAEAGWTDPRFFPIVSWFDAVSTDAEVAYDRALGFNTYVGISPSTPYRLFAKNDVYWIGPALNDAPARGVRHWVGYFLDDEADGRFSPVRAGLAHLRSLRAPLPRDRFAYANFTQMVISRDMRAKDAEAFVNRFTDAVSLDMYWYTIPFCGLTPYRAPYLVPVHRATCRTASSYGAVVDALRERDAADGRLQAVWQFVELLNGGPGEGPYLGMIKPGQLRGAVMSSLIHGARGIVYFNQSLTGPCQGGNLIRLSQVVRGFCGAAQVAAAGVVNNQVRVLAPVLNSQSYVYRFGPGLDTMLKGYDGYAYVFAMAGTSRPLGMRTFALPPGVDGNRVEVLFEHRTLPVIGRRFKDSFAAEYSYHVYRIPVAAVSAASGSPGTAGTGVPGTAGTGDGARHS